MAKKGSTTGKDGIVDKIGCSLSNTNLRKDSLTQFYEILTMHWSIGIDLCVL